jgi:aspartate racemase
LHTIGLIGGMSWESTAEYYRIINQSVRRRLGPLRSAPLIIYSVDFGPIQEAQHHDRWGDAAAILEDAAQRVYRGGAECIVLCTNTMHRDADRIQDAVPLPFIHIADPAGRAAVQSGFQTVGLLGTQFTMTQPFLRERLVKGHGLTVLVPPPAEQERVHEIIYDELCGGIIKQSSRDTYREVIRGMCERGAKAVILGCTEISLLLKPSDVEIPLVDTTALHAEAAVAFALGCDSSPPTAGVCDSSFHL